MKDQELYEKLAAEIKRIYQPQPHQVYHLQMYLEREKDVKYPEEGSGLSDKLILDHVVGRETIALKLIDPEAKASTVGIMDFDLPQDAPDMPSLTKKAWAFKRALEAHGVRAYVSHSGRRGYHVIILADKPMPVKTYGKLFRKISREAELGEPREYFPVNDNTNQKPIKLLLGLHRATGKRELLLAVEPEQFEMSGHPVPYIMPIFNDSLHAQLPLLQSVQATPVWLLEELAEEHIVDASPTSQNSEPNKIEEQMNIPEEKNTMKFTTARLDRLAKGQIPPCVKSLIVNGIPEKTDLNKGGMQLVNYGLHSKRSDESILELASQSFAATSLMHPTSKATMDAKMGNLRSILKTARQNPENYGSLQCSNMLSACPSFSRDGTCKGVDEPCWPKPVTMSSVATLPRSPTDDAVEEEALCYMIHEGSHAIVKALACDLVQGTVQSKKMEVTIGDKTHEISTSEILWECLTASLLNDQEPTPSVILSSVPQVVTKVLSLKKRPLSSVFLKVSQTIEKEIKSLKRQNHCEEKTFGGHLVYLEDRSLRQRTLDDLQKLIPRVADLDDKLSTAVADLSFRLDETMRQQSRHNLTHMTDMLDYLKELREEQSWSIPTGSTELNNLLGAGFKGGQLTYIAAQPKGGKTTFCLWLAQNAAEQGDAVLFFSLEMSKKELLKSMLSRGSKVNSRIIDKTDWKVELDNGTEWAQKYFDQFKETQANYQKKIAPYLQIIDGSKEVGIPEMLATIKSVRRKWGLHEKQPILVIVDSIQKLPSGSKVLDGSDNPTQRTTKVTTDLKKLAVRENLAMIAISEIQQRSHEKANDTGSLGADAPRDSFAVNHIVDIGMTFQSNVVETTTRGGKTEVFDQLSLYLKNHPDAGLINELELRKEYPKENEHSAYARLTAHYVRGGARGEVAFVYNKATHDFIAIDPSRGKLD